MTEKLVHWFLGLFSGISSMAFGKEIVIFILSCLPILELRGGLLAASLLGLDPLPSYILCVLGNLLPIPFILWFITPLFTRLKKTKLFSGMVKKLESKAMSKRDQIEKYQFWGLILFVGIPLPGTGAWTGCLIAALLDMDKKKAFIAAVIGVFLASIIMMFLSFGLLRGIVS